MPRFLSDWALAVCELQFDAYPGPTHSITTDLRCFDLTSSAGIHDTSLLRVKIRQTGMRRSRRRGGATIIKLKRMNTQPFRERFLLNVRFRVILGHSL